MDRRNFLKATLAVAGIGAVKLPVIDVGPVYPVSVVAVDPDYRTVQRWPIQRDQLVHRLGEARPRLIGRLHFEAEEVCVISQIVLLRSGGSFTLWTCDEHPLVMVAGDTLTVEE